MEKLNYFASLHKRRNPGKRQSFSPQEKSNLNSLIMKYQAIVENKKTDILSIAEKRRAWEGITEEFNSIPSNTKRSVEQLKKLWENIKFRRKIVLAGEKREKMRTSAENPSNGTVNNLPIPEDSEMYSMGVEVMIKEEMEDIDPPVMTQRFHDRASVNSAPLELPPVPAVAHVPRENGRNYGLEIEEIESAGENMEEAEIRCQRARLHIEQERELHELKKQELLLRISLLEQRIQNEKEIAALTKEKLNLDIKKLKELK